MSKVDRAKLQIILWGHFFDNVTKFTFTVLKFTWMQKVLRRTYSFQLWLFFTPEKEKAIESFIWLRNRVFSENLQEHPPPRLKTAFNQLNSGSVGIRPCKNFRFPIEKSLSENNTSITALGNRWIECDRIKTNRRESSELIKYNWFDSKTHYEPWTYQHNIFRITIDIFLFWGEMVVPSAPQIWK